MVNQESSATVPLTSRSGLIFVWAAILIFAVANSVVQLLTQLGAAHPVEGRNAISFCNLLFVGNACAFLTLLFIYHREWRIEKFKALSRGDWISLVVMAALSSALAPALIFMALEATTVSNVVLLGRIEPLLLMMTSFFVFREKADLWALLGAVTAFIGVLVIFYLRNEEGQVMLGRGELFAAVAAVVLVLSTLISKARLKRILLGIFMLFRTGLGAVIFFAAATYLFSIDHFQDAFNPFLWQWVAIYGAVIVVAGQICWFKGLGASDAGQAAVASSFTPIAGVLFVVVLLGERPEMPVLVGGAVILAGIVVANIGLLHRRAARRRAARTQGAAPGAGRRCQLQGRVSFAADMMGWRRMALEGEGSFGGAESS